MQDILAVFRGGNFPQQQVVDLLVIFEERAIKEIARFVFTGLRAAEQIRFSQLSGFAREGWGTRRCGRCWN